MCSVTARNVHHNVLFCYLLQTSEQLARARESVIDTVYNSTLASCGCSFDISQFTSHSLVCSYQVSGAISFRAIIQSTSEVRASNIYNAFSSWARTGPTIVVLGVEARVDASCDPLADSDISPECPEPPSDDDNPPPIELWVLVLICVGAVCLVAVVVVLFVTGCCCCWCCRKKGIYQ